MRHSCNRVTSLSVQGFVQSFRLATFIEAKAVAIFRSLPGSAFSSENQNDILYVSLFSGSKGFPVALNVPTMTVSFQSTGPAMIHWHPRNKMKVQLFEATTFNMCGCVLPRCSPAPTSAWLPSRSLSGKE